MIQRVLEEMFLMKIFTFINKIITIFIVLFFWFLLSKIYPPVVVPKISQVFFGIKSILSDISLGKEILVTICRLLLGFMLGTLFAIFISFSFIYLKFIKEIFYSIIGFLQVIPPISYLILAILWFGLNGNPSIFIVAISVFCIMSISLLNAMEKMDKKLLQIADVFEVPKSKRWKYIIIPYLYPAFETALIVCLGTGLKLTVMAELLSTNSGIGGEIGNARLNIETEMVIAWTIVIVAIYFVLGGVIKSLKKSKWLRNFWYRKLSAKNIKKELF